MEINLLKYFTFKRLFNSLKIILSFNLSRIIRKPIIWGMPITYSIEPTNYCNLQCPECPSGTGELTRPLGFLSISDFKRIVDEMFDTGFYLQLFFQGEPYLNKSLPEMIAYAQEKKIYVSVSTNGNIITSKNAERILKQLPDKIIFSIDGLDETSYQKYRVGGTFKQADEALKIFSDIKIKSQTRKPFIELQFIVMKQNEHLIEAVKSYGKERDVDRIVFKTMQVSSYENAKKYLPTDQKYSRYVLTNNNYKLKNKLKNHCFALWRTTVITWNYKMVPCCFDKDAKYILGDLKHSSIKNIWESQLYAEFRNGLLTDRAGIEMCTNCTEGLKVNILSTEI